MVARASEEPPQGTQDKPAPPGAPPPPNGEKREKLGGEDQDLQLPKEVIERLKFTVFGYDTFWVTQVDNYQADGVIFKGNVRGKDPGAAYLKLKERLRAELGDKYDIFLLEDKEEKPTVVVLPTGRGTDQQISRFTEIWLAVVFAVLTALTSFNSAGVPLLEFVITPMQTAITQADFTDALPGTLAFWFALGSHDFGHWQAAKRQGVELYTPFYIPAGFGLLGSFGSISRFKGLLPNREALLDISVNGPLLGTSVSLAMTLAGFALTAAGVTNVAVDSPAFADSFLIAVSGQLFLGDALLQPVVQVNALLLAGWAGLITNALNCIPIGELDGGRMVLGIWGRRTATAVSTITTLGLGIAAFTSTLAFYWILFVVLLQRGPILPCREELSVPKTAANRGYALGLMAMCLAVLVPFPVELVMEVMKAQDPTLIPF